MQKPHKPRSSCGSRNVRCIATKKIEPYGLLQYSSMKERRAIYPMSFSIIRAIYSSTDDVGCAVDDDRMSANAILKCLSTRKIEEMRFKVKLTFLLAPSKGGLHI